MTATRVRRAFAVALVGNPNTGKSSLFSALSGVHQRIGNFPGVTVEKKSGWFTVRDRAFEVIDLPGTYSVAARSADEMVALDVLLGRSGNRPPDAIVCVVDANNLERNLFLVSQLLHLNRPMLVALNMVDIARRNGVEIDVAELSRRLGVPVVPLQANKRIGIEALRTALVGLTEVDAAPRCPDVYPAQFVESLGAVQRCLPEGATAAGCFLAQRLLLDSSGEMLRSADFSPELRDEVVRQAARLKSEGLSLVSLEAIARYQWIGQLLKGIVRRPARRVTFSDRIDAVLTHRVLGTLIFAAVMLVMFQAVFAWAEPLMGGIEWGVDAVRSWLAAALPAGTLNSLAVDGVLSGVGGVLVFLPQIMVLFFFIALLEDCGYLARAAYLMDKQMSWVGLSGKSFIPLLSSFACAIPGIMAARIVENRRDRLITILVAPLMSCSARLPVYTLLISAFIPMNSYLGGAISLQALVMFAMYLIGILAAIAVAWTLRNTMLRGQAPPFVMELPEYKVPSVRLVIGRMLERAWAFVRRAGTVIVSVSILIWAAAYFPRNPASQAAIEADYDRRLSALAVDGVASDHFVAAQSALRAERDRVLSADRMKHSWLGRMGRGVEPVVRPLGWDWKIASAAIASFPARELFVAALGVIYSVGDSADEASVPLREQLRQAKRDGTDAVVYNVPVALSILVFFALCAQCVSTLVVIRRETNQWRWPAFAFAYMTALAYAGAWVTYQVGSRLAS
jgi:ferrous iron transport protein B